MTSNQLKPGIMLGMKKEMAYNYLYILSVGEIINFVNILVNEKIKIVNINITDISKELWDKPRMPFSIFRQVVDIRFYGTEERQIFKWLFENTLGKL